MRRLAQLAARAFTFAFVASGVALQLAGTVHLAVVQHAYCAEHGEAVDVARGAAQRGRAESTTAGLERGQPDDRSGSESDSHHAHSHCRLDEDRSTHALVVYAALLAAAPAPLAIVPPPYAPHARATARVLQLLAPKTSPPA